ncbi:MAG: hypothetical protein WCG91_04055 [Candidatus Shapirobacteria bacterium]
MSKKTETIMNIISTVFVIMALIAVFWIGMGPKQYINIGPEGITVTTVAPTTTPTN